MQKPTIQEVIADLTAIKVCTVWRKDRMSAIKMAIEALRFKAYFDALYGTGLEVANWHKNGALEPFDTFYENAMNNKEEQKAA